jgi:hypothetical protein
VCHSGGYNFEGPSTIVGLQNVKCTGPKSVFGSTFLSNIMAIFKSTMIQNIKYF